ncbi:NADPH-dependent oxidoreductase [bacterium]|nr:MAG: NADPH-dependent oxidoreductase [bacterium]
MNESFTEAWQARYGAEPGFELPELAGFLRHRSIRRYTGEPIPEPLERTLYAAAQSAATSSNLQLYSIVKVQAPERREKMAELTHNRPHVEECALFLAFVADLHRLRSAAIAHDEPAEALGSTEFYTMACVDAALAAERLVTAAEAAGLGICYIGGLRDRPAEVKEFLHLPPLAFGLFGLCIGWPHPEAGAEIKPRLPQHSVVFEETYPASVDLEEYDARMRGFYESQAMKGEFAWTARSARRAGTKALGPRSGQRGFLDEQGLGVF